MNSYNILKTCHRCKETQSTELFERNRQCKDGFYPTCKACLRRQRSKPFRLTPEVIARFWSHVDKTPGLGPNGDCWLWKMSTDKDGYGQFAAKKVPLRSHRVSFLIEHGKLPDDNKAVAHTCDTPQCVNPAHLWAATTDENNKDKAQKGRATGRGFSPRTSISCQQCGSSFDVIPSRIGKAKYCSITCQLTVVHRPRTPKHLRKGQPCTVDGCSRLIRGHGMCSMHYSRLRRGQNLNAPPRRYNQNLFPFPLCQ